MPYARVGPMARPSKPKGHQRNEGSRSARQKGITMEDLKKQTALRLAQEQHHQSRGAYPGIPNDDRAPRGLAGPGSSAFLSMQPQPPTSHVDHYSYHGGIQNQSNVVRPHPVVPSAVPTHFPPPNQNIAAATPTDGAPKHNIHSEYSDHGNKPSQLAGVASPVAGRVSPRRYNDQRQRYPHQAVSPAHGAPGHASSGHLSNVSDHSSSRQQSGGMPKLPHGLTVHELKEMTKARLQAEEAERQESDKQNLLFESPAPGVGQQSFQAVESREPGLANLAPAKSSESLTPRQDSRVSPQPPGMQSYGSLTPSLSPFVEGGGVAPSSASSRNRDTWSQQSKVDGWETASVASHNSTVSDYLGSESAYSTGVSAVPSQSDDMGNISFSHSRSYPSSSGGIGAPEIPSYENTPVPSPGGPFFDSSVSGRRRACTLSPRPGLSYLHEDRPLYKREELGIPNFQTSSRNPLAVRARNSYSPILMQGSQDGYRGLRGAGVIGGNLNDANRRRTQSADMFIGTRTASSTSLPPFSNSYEEFGLERSGSGFVPGPTSYRSTDVPSAVAESVLGSSLMSAGNGATENHNFLSVFRDAPLSGRPISSHSPLNENNFRSISTSSSMGVNPVSPGIGSSGSFVDPRVNGGWGGIASEALDFADSKLADDLGSILKLSGATERSDQGQRFSSDSNELIGGSQLRSFGF